MNRPRVVVIEDSPIVADHFRWMLTEIGACVVGVFRTTPVALDRVAELKPNYVFLDLHFPGPLDGTSIAAVIRRLGIKGQIVFVTGIPTRTPCPE